MRIKSNIRNGAFAKIHKHRFVIGTTLIVIVGFGISNGHSEKSHQANTAPLVRTFTIHSSYAGGARYTGTVHARTESDLGFRVPGKITEKLVDQGTRVTKGQALMRLDPTDLVLATKAAEEAVEAAHALNEQALLDEVRMRDLLAAQAVSRQDYEKAKALADATTAQLKAAEAQAQKTANQGKYAVLKADADGVVMEVPADVGQVVAAGQTVVRLAHDGTREAVINLPEGTQAQAEDSATAFLYADPGTLFPAKLRELSAMADPVTRTYQARYTLGEAGKVAPLGATVTVILEAKQSDASGDPEVPIGALYDNGSGTGVWVIDEMTSTVTLRQVKVTHLGEETASVSGELQLGERIVALGAHLLKPAEKIRLAAATREEDAK